MNTVDIPFKDKITYPINPDDFYTLDLNQALRLYGYLVAKIDTTMIRITEGELDKLDAIIAMSNNYHSLIISIAARKALALD